MSWPPWCCPAAGPASCRGRPEAARGLVNVHDAVCADSVLLHEPAQLDEEQVRVGVLLLTGVELLQALGGLLDAQAHATQELSDPSIAGTHVESLCVEPLEHQAVDRDRAQAQHVGHLHDGSLNRVVSAGDSMLLLPRVSARGALRFQR